MNMYHVASYFTATVALSGISAAAPFGLEMGDRPPDFAISRDNGDGTVVIASVPKAYPGLKQFFGRYDTQHGLCSIAGATEPFNRDYSGTAARLYFKQLAASLTRRYGPSTIYDIRLGNPAAVSHHSWSEEIAREDRLFYQFWNEPSGARLKDSIVSIALSIGAAENSAPFVLLQFDFSNLEDCEAAQTALEATAL